MVAAATAATDVPHLRYFALHPRPQALEQARTERD